VKDIVMPDAQPQSQIVARRRHWQPSLVDNGKAAATSHSHDAVTTLLNDALAREMVRTLRCQRHPTLACLVQPSSADTGYREGSIAPNSHADWIAERIVELGGELEFRNITLAELTATPPEPGTLMLEVIRENLAYERALVESHLGFLRYLGSSDPVTQSLLEAILATEEACVRELVDRLTQLTSARGQRSMSSA
jgi:bacterioferritin